MAKKFIIGIDLGGTNLKIALLDLKYKIRDKEVLSTRRLGNKKGLTTAIVSAINSIIENNKLSKSNILGVGMGLPGPIDAERGIVHFFPNIPGFREVNLKNILEKKLRMRVFLDNDAKLMALAEHRLGSARSFKNVLCLTLGTGVGGGLIIGGRLYRGFNNASAEVGHIPLNEKGPACNCGGSACLEAYIGNNRITKYARRLFKRGISLEELSAKAKNNDTLALRIWHRIGEQLGIALAGVVNLLNLDAIVIGGGVANAGPVLFDKVSQALKERAMSVQSKHVKVLQAALGSNAGLIGAAIAVRERMRP